MARALTEEQYLRLEQPGRAAGLFNSRSPLRTSTRKARLFLCACCRRVWGWLGPDANRAAVEAAERAADGLMRVKDRRPFYEATQKVTVPLHKHPNAWTNPAGDAAWPFPWCLGGWHGATWLAGLHRGGDDATRQAEAIKAECVAQCGLIRDLLGNPFRRLRGTPLAAPPRPGGAAVKLARAIYEGRSFADLPVLADALEDEGCADADVLDHLHRPAEHARGCWALDLVLGKEC
jgi:hypothetical protein